MRQSRRLKESDWRNKLKRRDFIMKQNKSAFAKNPKNSLRGREKKLKIKLSVNAMRSIKKKQRHLLKNTDKKHMLKLKG